MSAADTSKHPALRIQRTLTFQADPQRIIDAWCDPAVQARILHGAAKPLGEADGGTLWRIDAPLGQSPEVRLQLESRDDQGARHRAEGDGGFRLRSELSTVPARGRPGVEATLHIEFHADGLLTGLVVRHVDPAPVLLAGQALRRLRAWVEAGQVPSLARNPSARPAEAASDD